MSIHSILVPLDGDTDNAAVLQTALNIARHFPAHVDVFHVRADSRDVAPMFGEGMSGEMMEEMIASAEQAANEQAERVEQLFTKHASASDTAHWMMLEGREDDLVAKRGRLSDLIVAARANENSSPMRDMTLHAALFESGRPVLMLPPNPDIFDLPETVAVAWNGTAQAARAVQGAMPFITRAKAVHVLTCESTRTEVTAADELADYLRRWGVTADVHAFPPKDGDVGSAILLEADKIRAGLVVSGAYSHARMMQAVLGGVTTALMDDAPVPVLFSH